MTKTIKRVVSVLLALAMVVTSLNYTPKTVEAAVSLTEGNTTYSVGDATGDYTGFVVQGAFPNDNPPHFGFAWDETNGSATANVVIKAGEETKVELGTKTSGQGINLSELKEAGLSDGDYTIVFTGIEKEDQIKYVPLTVTTAGETDPVDPTEPTELSALKDAYVYNFTETGEGFKVGFSDPNKITVPEGATYTYTLNINGQKIENIQKSNEVVDLSGLNLTEGTEYSVTMNAVYTNGDVTITSADSTSTKFTYNTSATTAYDNGIPQIFITTSRNDTTSGVNLYTDTSKTKVNAALMIKNADGTLAVDSNYGTANVRGNSTSLADKKAYNIKFDKKVNPFNMGSAKKWSLLANIFDKTLIRNQIGMDFQRALEESQGTFAEDGASKVFTSNCKSVDLYIDGKYLGTYLLIESVETGTDRVNIDVSYSEEDTDEYTEGATPDEVTYDGTTYSIFDALLELETERGDDDAYFFSTGVERFAINEPERTNKDKYSSQPGGEGSQPEWVGLIKTFVQGFETALQSNDFDRFSQFIDVDSFVDFYITSEYFMTKDIGLSSTRFYIRNGKLYAGPLWDLDLSSGNIGDHEGAEDLRSKNAFKWFELLMNNETFLSKVKARYEELLPQIKELYADGGKVDQAVENIRASAITNYENAYNYKRAETDEERNVGWGYTWLYGTAGSGNGATETLVPGAYGSYGSVTVHEDYDTYITEYKSWLKARNEYLLKEFKISDPEEVIEADDYEKLIANKFYNLALDKTTTLYKNCHQEGKQEYLNDGLLTSGTCPLTNADAVDNWGTENSEAYATIDLGTVYKASSIDQIFIEYKDGAANDTVLNKPYKILYSIDGNEFYEAVSVESAVLDADNRTIDQVSTVEGNVRYVRVYYPQQAQYGMQIKEVAVIANDASPEEAEAEEVPVPTATVSVPEGTYNTITCTITANDQAAEGTKYTIYVGGNPVKTVDAAGEYELTGIAAGTYTVTVKAVYNGWPSDAAEAGTVEVKDGFTYTPGTKNTAFDSTIDVNGATYYDYTDYEGVSASAPDEAMAAKNAIDNDIGTRWGTAEADPKELIIDLGAVRNINQVAMVWETASAKDYTIQVSEDGNDYTTVAAITGAAEGAYRLDTIDFADAVSARYVKVYGTARTTQWGYSIWEMAIYGPDRYSAEPVYEVSGVAATVNADAKTTVITWKVAEDAITANYTYTVKIDNQVVAENIVATAGTTDAIDISALTEGQTYPVTVETIDADGNVVATATGTFTYTNPDAKPDLVAYISVDVPGGELVVGKEVNFTVTIVNEGTADAVTTTRNDTESNFVIKWTHDKAEQDWYVVPVSELTQQGDSYVLKAGESISHTFAKTLTDEMITGDYMVGGIIKLENGLDATLGDANMDNNQSEEIAITLSTLPNPTNVKTSVNSDQTVKVTWDAAKEDDSDTNTYSYMVYVDGVSATETPITDTEFTTDVLSDGTHTIKVVAVLDEDTSNGVSIDTIVYNEANANWVQWTIGPTTDKYDNTWYYSDNMLDGKDLIKDHNYFQISDNGTKYQSVIKVDGTGAAMVNITTVTIDGTVYEVSRTDKENSLAFNDGGDQLFLDVSLFELPEGVKQQIHAITVTGTLNGTTTSKSYLVKIVNENLITVPEVTNLVANINKGTVEVTWDAAKLNDTDQTQYTYKVYVDDAAVPVAETTDLKATIEGLSDGIHTIKVVTESSTEQSSGVTTKVLAYAEPEDDAWVQWDAVTYGNTKDSYGKDWYIAENVLDYNKVNMVANWFGLLNDGNLSPDGTVILGGAPAFEVPITGEGGGSIKSVTVNGVTYTTEDTDMLYSVGDRFYLNQEIFKLAEGETSKVFAITASGNADTTFLIKVEQYVQKTSMDWTRLVSAGFAGEPAAGEEYLFPVASNSQKAYIEYKVIDTNITDADYDDIVSRYVGYQGANMTIEFNAAHQIINYTEPENGVDKSNTVLEFAQDPNYKESEDVLTNVEDLKWLTIATKSCIIDLGNGEQLAVDPNDAPVTYAGNGMNFFVGNFGLYKTYLTRLTTPEGYTVTIAYRVTDGNEHTGAWSQALQSDNISNPNILPVYYCGADTENYDDVTDHEATEGIALYETTGALWYDASDIMLSSISVYNGNWLSVATSQYLDLDKDAYGIGIARAEVDASQNNKFIPTDDNAFVKINPQEGRVGIQGTNTVQIGLPWLLQELPIHSEKGGQKDTEYYWLRIYADMNDKQEESDTQLANYVDIPITIYADIPEIKEAQNVSAQQTADEETDKDQFMVTWSSLPEQDVYGYTYRVFVGDTELIAEGDTEPKVYSAGQTLTFDYATYADALLANNNKVKVVAYWCEQAIATEAEVSEPKQPGWNYIDGDSNINIQAGQNQFVDLPGEIRYYYDKGQNHASLVVGYNGDYISLNGNKKYYNTSSTVSVATEVFDSEDAGTALTNEAIAAASYKYEDVETYTGSTDGQVQILAKNVFTAKHLNSYYIVKIETPVLDENGEATEDVYTNYIKFHSTVEAGGVELKGFQMNTNAQEGGVSEFSPSFRVVSRAAKIVTVEDGTDNPAVKAVVNYGTLYGLQSQVGNDMTLSYDKDTKTYTTSENAYYYEADEEGTLQNWSGSVNDADKDNYSYYALTFKPQEYALTFLETKYSLKAYAVTEDGDVIFDTTEDADNNVRSTSVEEIATTLYQGSMMSTQNEHDFLYNNVLNILAIKRNRTNIANAMLKALNVTSKEEDNYKYVNTLYHDLYYYIYLVKEYEYSSYTERGAFTSKTKIDGVENETLLLNALNGADGTYGSVSDWIVKNVTTDGFYTTVTYDPGNTSTVSGSKE